MAPGILQANKALSFPQGAHWDAVFTIYTTYDPDNSNNNVVLDLTGYTASIKFRSPNEESDSILGVTTSDYITNGTTAGTLTLAVPKSVTQNINATPQGILELQIVPPTGSEYTETVLYANFKITRWVNRS